MSLFFIYFVRPLFLFGRNPNNTITQALGKKALSRFLAVRTVTQVISVVATMAARGQCNSLLVPSAFPPIPFLTKGRGEKTQWREICIHNKEAEGEVTKK